MANNNIFPRRGSSRIRRIRRIRHIRRIRRAVVQETIAQYVVVL